MIEEAPNNIDLFNLEDPNSIVRKIICKDKEINLKEFVETKFVIPLDYIIKEFKIKKGDSLEINSLIDDEMKKFRLEGYPENIYTPIYEAILNAYQHGNKRDQNKKVIFAYKLNNANLITLVEDEGGIIDPLLIPFILKHREMEFNKKSISFYKFSQREKPKENNGTGTSFMHIYMDKINYYLGEHGLIVHMIKNKH